MVESSDADATRLKTIQGWVGMGGWGSSENQGSKHIKGNKTKKKMKKN